MVQKKRSEKTAEDLQTERITAALEETDRTGKTPDFIRENPGQFLRDMYEVWHRQGGKEGGRWRNSIRKMRDEWLTGRNAVPSLHPKLMGRVKVTRSDARALIDLFLTRWRYGEDNDPVVSMTSDGYIEFTANDRRLLRDILLSGVIRSSEPSKGIDLPIQRRERDSFEETKRRWVNVEQVMRESDALITLSRHRIAVGGNTIETMTNFWHFLNHLYLNDQKSGESNRILVWVVDIGERLVEQEFSFSEYYNAGLLALQLKSFACFDSIYDDEKSGRSLLLPRLRIAEDVHRNQRWDWLSERTIIAVQNLRREEFDGLYEDQDAKVDSIRLKEIGVTAENILPNKTPREWSKTLRLLYGRQTEAADATITVFYKEIERPQSGPARDIRYFAHGPASGSVKPEEDPLPNVALSTRSIELQSPGQNYDDAFRLLYWAARFRLGLGGQDEREQSFDALAYLRHHSFRFLLLNDFLRVFS